MYAMSMTCCGDYPVLTVASERTRPLNVIPEGIAAIISCIFLILMSNLTHLKIIVGLFVMHQLSDTI